MKKLTIQNIQQKTEAELEQLFRTAYNDKITELDISRNNLCELSDDLTTWIAILTSLQSLKISWNHLTTLSSYLSDLPQLKELITEGNPLIDPPVNILRQGGREICSYLKEPVSKMHLIRIIREAKKNSVRVMDLNRREIQELPEEIGELDSLEVLKLRQNRLSSLPQKINRLQNLTRLELGDNRFSEFPVEILQLKKLEILDLGANLLKSIPPEIRLLSHLRQLNLSANQLAELPPNLGQLNQLEILEVSFNQLESLPQELAQLPKLRELGISGNRWSSRPEVVRKLEAVEVVDVGW